MNEWLGMVYTRKMILKDLLLGFRDTRKNLLIILNNENQEKSKNPFVNS